MSGTTSPPHHELTDLDTTEVRDNSQFNDEEDNPDALRGALSPSSPLVDYNEVESLVEEIRDGSNTVENEPRSPVKGETLDLWLQDAKLSQDDTGILLNDVIQARDAPSSTLSKVGNRTDDKGPNPTHEP